MALCLQYASFVFEDGSYGLGLTPAFGVPASECADGGVMLTAAEYAQFQAGGPLSLSPEQGALVSTAICGVWLIAWAFRRFIQVLNVADE